MANRSNVPEGDIISVPVDSPQVEQFVEDAMKKNPSKTFTEDDVESIRKQEKDKMYKRLEDADTRVKAMEEQMGLIAQEREAAQKEAEARANKESDLIREREVSELSAKELLLKREDEFNVKLSQIEQDYKTRFDEIERQRSQQEALLEKTVCTPCWSWKSTSKSYKSNTTGVQCSGITKKGARCRRTTSNANGRCHQHQ